MSKNRDFRPKREVYRAQPPTEAASDVGDSYSVTYERHATYPKLWRLHERIAIKGRVFEFHTDWLEFADFSPKMGLQYGRQRDFLLPKSGTRRPQLVRTSREA